MNRKGIWMALLLAVVFLLGGCAMRTVDQMYCLPKRSEEYNNLQNAIDREMSGLEYCAPLSGENQQSVQMADLTGDGVPEYLLFAKGSGEKPLQILIFRQEGEEYVLAQTIQSSGSAFEQVEYVQMDGREGCELVVGRQLSDQVLRSVSVYSFADGEGEQLITANYTRFLTCDLDGDSLGELMILCPGQQETDNGVAELYRFRDGVAERSTEVNMSEPVDKLKRVITGRLEGGPNAVFVASTVEESAIITDVFAIVNGRFANVSLSNESGTSVQTLRSYYVYADDIDEDGVVELPSLVTMISPAEARSLEQQYLIRWYAMRPDGSEVDKMFTYHNFMDGWYLRLEPSVAGRMTVVQERESGESTRYAFYLWDEAYTNMEKLLTVYVLTGDNREDAAARDNRFILYNAENTIYAARLEAASAAWGLSSDTIIQAFHMIRMDWKTGET